MTLFTYHTKETAPTESMPLMEQSFKTYGFVPKLHQVMAEAPITYEAYLNTYNLFHDASHLSPLERQIVMMTSNYENRCHYCTAGHSLVMKWEEMPDDFIEALRDGKPLADTKLEALRTFSRLLLEKRGHIGDAELQKFLDAGYAKRQALEVLTGLAAKLLSNFTNALAHTELDEPVVPLAWVHPDERH